MAKDIVIAGATFNAVPSIEIPTAQGGTARYTDTSGTTATADDVAEGKVFYNAYGVETAGTASGGGGTLITKTITENGTYSAEDDDADGYSQVTVNVSGGGGSSGEKAVIFIDYDGTELYTYTAEEANALTELPTAPSHENMTSQGWNHTLAQVKADAAKGVKCVVGAMHTTEATVGTRLYCRFKNPNYLSPKLGIGPNSGSINIDWGDGSSIDSLSGSSLTTLKQKQHTYAAPGEYTIKLVRNESAARFGFIGDSTHSRTLDDDSRSDIYPASVYRIMYGGDARLANYCLSGLTRLECVNIPSFLNEFPQHMFRNCRSLKAFVVPLREGKTHTIGANAFYGCQSLKYVSLSKTVKTIGNEAFYGCEALESINLPSSLTSISSAMLRGCFKLKDVYIPDTVTSIGGGAFYDCRALESISLPSGVTSIGNYAFRDCRALKTITIPSGVTSLSDSLFYGCRSLETITIPSGVTSISNYAFYDCGKMSEIHFLPETPPTLQSTSAFFGTPGDCIFYVPYSADHSVLTAYKAAQNWSTYADRMVEEQV